MCQVLFCIVAMHGTDPALVGETHQKLITPLQCTGRENNEGDCSWVGIWKMKGKNVAARGNSAGQGRVAGLGWGVGKQPGAFKEGKRPAMLEWGE